MNVVSRYLLRCSKKRGVLGLVDWGGGMMVVILSNTEGMVKIFFFFKKKDVLNFRNFHVVHSLPGGCSTILCLLSFIGALI